MYLMDYFTIPMSLAGIPAMSVPAGYVDDLPVGLQIVAPAFEEGAMLGVAHAYEQATQHAWERTPPVAGDRLVSDSGDRDVNEWSTKRSSD